jgi:hypothetical protein
MSEQLILPLVWDAETEDLLKIHGAEVAAALREMFIAYLEGEKDAQQN